LIKFLKLVYCECGLLIPAAKFFNPGACAGKGIPGTTFLPGLQRSAVDPFRGQMLIFAEKCPRFFEVQEFSLPVSGSRILNAQEPG
jgi:hypothetical protein